jgi:hypothetical protein
MSSIADGRTGVRLLRWYNTLTVSSPIHGHHFKIRSGFPHLMAVISDSHCLFGFEDLQFEIDSVFFQLLGRSPKFAVRSCVSRYSSVRLNSYPPAVEPDW